MSDRFNKYPTKRMPEVNKNAPPDYFGDNNIDDTVENAHTDAQHDFDDDFEYDVEQETKPSYVERRREWLENKSRPQPNASRRSEYGTRTPRRTRATSVVDDYDDFDDYDDDISRKPTYRNSASIAEKGKMALVGMYIFILFIAVALCIVAVVVVINLFRENAPDLNNIIGERDPSIVDNDPPPQAMRPQIENMDGMITRIDTATMELDIVNVDSLNAYTFPIADDVTLRNRDNTAMTFSQLRIGQLVEVSYDINPDVPIITEMREHTRSIFRNEQRNVHINLENNTVSVGTEAFLFNSQTLVIHRGDRIPIGQIRPSDSVSITALPVDRQRPDRGAIAWVIQLDSASGTFMVANAGHIVNGRIIIGNLHPLLLHELNEPIDIPEGPHRVEIEGDNIDTIIENIIISPGQPFVLNLGDIELNQATLEFDITPAGATVFINDERVTGNSTNVDFGTHAIRVEHAGYISHEAEIIVNESTTSISVDLEAEITTARLTISTIPINAHILVDGVQVGTSSPNIVLELEPGTYLISARVDGFFEYNMFITLTQQQEAVRTISLTRIPDDIDEPEPGNQDGDNNQGSFIPPLPPPLPPPAP